MIIQASKSYYQLEVVNQELSPKVNEVLSLRMKTQMILRNKKKLINVKRNLHNKC